MTRTRKRKKKMNFEVQDPTMAGTSTSNPKTGATRVWEPSRLTYKKLALTHEDVLLITNPNLRQKFIIFGIEPYTKEQILEAVIKACLPEILLPAMYNVEERNKATFIARCNVVAIKCLMKHGLRIQMPDGCSLGMDIVLGYADSIEININPQRDINKALKMRYEHLRKVLNLNDFKNDKCLSQIYCPISCPRIFSFVLRCCSIHIFGNTGDGNKMSVRELNLRSNGISTLSSVDKCFNFHLTKVDLRNNEIINLQNINHFKDSRITELWLDGNPLCSRYTRSEDYIQDVRSIFPHLQKLDGIVIGIESKIIPIVRMSYLADLSRTNLVQQFIRHFFMFYDQNDRIVMNGLYERDAFFSVTLGPITSSAHLQMTKAFANDRNVKKFVDYARCHEYLLQGPEKIIAALRRQPATHHDYQKFNVDIMHFTDDCITIAVQGSFYYKEYPTPPLFFNRTFVLVEIEENEYCIVNDLYHIQSESTPVKNVYDPRISSLPVPKIEPTVFSLPEKQQLVHFLSNRTTMNTEYSHRFLNDSNWNIRAALESFVKSYTINDIPREAFRKPT